MTSGVIYTARPQTKSIRPRTMKFRTAHHIFMHCYQKKFEGSTLYRKKVISIKRPVNTFGVYCSSFSLQSSILLSLRAASVHITLSCFSVHSLSCCLHKQLQFTILYPAVSPSSFSLHSSILLSLLAASIYIPLFCYLSYTSVYIPLSCYLS